jgi:hypothetical protein
MRNLLLILVLGFSLNLFAQMQIPELKFVFESKTSFTEQFQDKQNSKQFSLTVEGISSQIDLQALIHMVKQTRGVEEFTVETKDNGQIIAKLKVYRYATGWWYWKTFMQKSGVPTFQIENVNYNSSTISSQE